MSILTKKNIIIDPAPQILEVFTNKHFSQLAYDNRLIYQENDPFPHIVFDDFLPLNIANLISNDYPTLIEDSENYKFHNHEYVSRYFLEDANKFSNSSIYINLKSDSEITEISIEDDGDGYPRDVLSKIGEPYLRSSDMSEKSKSGLGLGLFIGKTLLEKNFASINCRNSKTRTGAEIVIKWRNKDLFNI